MSKIINNKKPVSERMNNATINANDVYMNETALDNELKKELEEQGLVGRFINASLYAKTGFHRAKWVPYKRKSSSAAQQIFGQVADGYTRRGDLILAVKSKADVELQKQFLKQRTQSLSQHAKLTKEELRELAAKNGVKSHISDDYGDDDSEF